MELTPKAFRDVQFREKLRGGYHPEDVDEFLEQAALALEALLEQFRQATERAQRAEQAATEATATDEALKRVLLIAQRTADQAIGEAREEADQLLTKARDDAQQLSAQTRDEAQRLSTKAREEAQRLSTKVREEAQQLSTEAREEADRLLTEARAQAAATLADAEERGRRAYESDLATARASMENADEALRVARQEVESLRDWVDTHKAHLLGVLRDAQDRVEKAGLLSEPPPVRSGDGPGAADGPEVRAEAESLSGAGAEGGAGPVPDVVHTGGSEDQTAEWDPHYLQDFEAEGGDGQLAAPPLPPPARSNSAPAPSEESVPAAAAAHGAELDITEVDVTDVGAPATPAAAGEDEGPEAEGGAVVQPGPGDTVAFDERALDSFFSDQDLGQQRGGFFRRRQ